MSFLPPDRTAVRIARGLRPFSDLTSGVFTDITRFVRFTQGLSIRRGRQRALDRYEAGEMSCVLDNSDRRFEPEFTTGAYDPDIVPGLPIRVFGAYGAFLGCKGLSATTGEGYIRSTDISDLTPAANSVIDAFVRVDFDDVTPAWNQIAFDADSNKIRIQLLVAGQFRWRLENSAGTDQGGNSTAGIPAGTKWLKVSHDTSITTNAITFSTSDTDTFDPDVATFTTLGALVNGVSAGFTFPAWTTLAIGGFNDNGNDPVTGKIYRVTIRDDATDWADADIYAQETWAPGTGRTAVLFTDRLGATWTLGSAGSDVREGTTFCDKALLLEGTDGTNSKATFTGSTPTTDVEMIAHASIDESFGINQILLTAVVADVRRRMWVDTNGRLRSDVRVGGTPSAATSSVAVPAGTIWLRWVHNLSTGDRTFYTSTDTTFDRNEVTWTQLGTVQTGGGTGTADTYTDAHVGSDSDGTDTLNGSISHVVLLDDSTADIDWNAYQQADLTSFVAADGNTWTMQGTDWAQTLLGVEQSQFTGYIEGFPQTWPASGVDAIVPIAATDAFEALGGSRLALHGYNAAVIADSVDAYYPMQERTGTNTEDESGNNNDGTINGAVTLGLEGPFDLSDTAYSFPGATTAYVDIGDLSTVLTRERTIELWYKLTSAPGDGDTIIRFRSSGTLNRLYISDPGDGTRQFTYRGPNNTVMVNEPGWDLSDASHLNEWHHLSVRAFAEDAFPHNESATFRLDAGAQLGVGLGFSGSASQVADAVRIGADATNSFDGQLAHVGLYAGQLAIADLNERFADNLVMPVELSSVRIGRTLDDAGWPTAMRNITSGNETMQATPPQTQAVLGFLRHVEETERGSVFITKTGFVRFQNRAHRANETSAITFDDVAGIKYTDLQLAYDLTLVRNIVESELLTTGERRHTEDATSITTHGARPPHSVKISLTAAAADTQATRYLTLFKDPQFYARRLTVQPSKDTATLWPQVLTRRISDKIRVKWTPPGGGAQIDKTMHIERTAHTVTHNDWVTTWELSPQET